MNQINYKKQPYDTIEDQEFLQRQVFEKIPKNIKYLKDHPLYFNNIAQYLLIQVDLLWKGILKRINSLIQRSLVHS